MSPGTPPSGYKRFLVLVACVLAALDPAGIRAAVPAPVAQNTAVSSPAPAAALPEADVSAGSSAPTLADAEIEQFLLRGKFGRTRGSGKGVTDSLRVTMSDGTFTHDAHIQTVDEYRREFRGTQGTEFDFKDSWGFNVAAYKLDRLIGLHMVPVSVERSYRSKAAAVTWWVDNVIMDEGGRVKKNLQAPPDKAQYWTDQVHMLRVFDQLIYNTDRNLGNMLIGQDWRLWAIDHTRAFRKHTTLRSPGHVTRCDHQVFEQLKSLDVKLLSRELGRYLDGGQIKGILARRDEIVKRLESVGAAALFDRQPNAVAGAGVQP